MRFIRDLIKNKNWSDNPADGELSADDLRRDFAEEDGFESPLIGRGTHQALDLDDDDDWIDDDFDLDEPEAIAVSPEPAHSVAKTEPSHSHDLSERFLATLNDPANDQFGSMSEDEDDDFDDYDPLEDEAETADGDWNIGLAAEDEADTAEDYQIEPDFEDEFDEEMDVFDDPLFHDEGSAREIEQAAIEAVREQHDLTEIEKEALLEEIRKAMEAVRHIRSDEEIGRQSAARDQLGRVVDAARDDRILDETNEIMNEDDGARRRQAIALMKAAAHATKSDPNLRKLAGRDSALDTDEQSEYRMDLESMAVPGLRTSRSKRPSHPVEESRSDTPPKQSVRPAEVAPRSETARTPSAPRKNVGLNDLPVLDRPAKVHSEILRERGVSLRRRETPAGGNDLRSKLEEARAAKPVEVTTRPVVQEPKQAMNIWDIDKDDDEDEVAVATPPARPARPAPTPIVQVPQPTQGRSGRQARRVKTRLLGFQHEDENEDPFASDAQAASVTAGVFPVGWLVIVDGPGCGKAFALGNGVSQIGRGEGQTVRLDFGDLAVSRENHAAIAYDDEKNTFYLGHGGKSNLVRLNSSPVLSTETLSSGDRIRIGETTLRFVAFCDEGFNWTGKDDANDAQRAFG